MLESAWFGVLVGNILAIAFLLKLTLPNSLNVLHIQDVYMQASQGFTHVLIIYCFNFHFSFIPCVLLIYSYIM